MYSLHLRRVCSTKQMAAAHFAIAKGAAFAWARRWWTPTAPTLAPDFVPISGWRWPLILVTRELLCEKYDDVAWYLAAHRRVYYSFDADYYVYAWWPIAPAARLIYWWRHETRWRFAVERALRGRVVDIRDGDYLSNWKLRPLSRWTWRRTR